MKLPKNKNAVGQSRVDDVRDNCVMTTPQRDQNSSHHLLLSSTYLFCCAMRVPPPNRVKETRFLNTYGWTSPRSSFEIHHVITAAHSILSDFSVLSILSLWVPRSRSRVLAVLGLQFYNALATGGPLSLSRVLNCIESSDRKLRRLVTVRHKGRA